MSKGGVGQPAPRLSEAQAKSQYHQICYIRSALGQARSAFTGLDQLLDKLDKSDGNLTAVSATISELQERFSPAILKELDTKLRKSLDFTK